MIKSFPHLQLTEWPFRVISDVGYCNFMADRTRLGNDINELVTHLSRQNISSLNMIWAWFGAGKTHTLHYTEFPKSVRSFIDLYKSFVTTLGLEALDEAYVDIFGDNNQIKLQADIKRKFPDLVQALKIHFIGNEEQQDASMNWLYGDLKDKKTLRNLSIINPIQDSEDATKAIETYIKLLCNIESKQKYNRVIWLIDEYQRINDLNKRVTNEINSSIHSIFNNCPYGLTILLCFSGEPDPKRFPSWLTPEIKDRLDRKTLLHPPLSKDEARIFILDLLSHFHDNSTNNNNPYFPFTKESVKAIIDYIEKQGKELKIINSLKPRSLMQVFDLILRSADTDIEKKIITVIDTSYSLKILQELSLFDEEDR
jgi:hypothetical protein